MDAVQIEELKKRVSDLAVGLMPRAAFAFAEALMANYTEVLNDIQKFYNQNRINHAAEGYATRMHRHALFIRLTEELFSKYLYGQEMIYSDDRNALEEAMKEQIRWQQSALQKIRLSEETCDYVAEFYELISAEDKYIKVCINTKTYEGNEDSCLLQHGKLYITTSLLKKAFFKRHEKYVPIKNVIDELHKKGILEEEPASKGRQKNFLSQKHYVINMFFNKSPVQK